MARSVDQLTARIEALERAHRRWQPLDLSKLTEFQRIGWNVWRRQADLTGTPDEQASEIYRLIAGIDVYPLRADVALALFGYKPLPSDATDDQVHDAYQRAAFEG